MLKDIRLFPYVQLAMAIMKICDPTTTNNSEDIWARYLHVGTSSNKSVKSTALVRTLATVNNAQRIAMATRANENVALNLGALSPSATKPLVE